MITDSTVFDIVAITPNSQGLPHIAVYNGTTFVAELQMDYDVGAYDTSTDEFQVVLSAIQEGAAYEQYRIGSFYTDSDLPIWLSWVREQNPFHQSALAGDTDAETEAYNELWFKKDIVFENLTLTFPDFDHTSTQDAYDAFEAAGWSREVIDPDTVEDGQAIYEMRLIRKRIPVFNDNGVLLSYDLEFIGIDITTGTRQYSSDNLNWHASALSSDIYFAEVLPDGSWQSYLLEPENPIVPAGTTKTKTKGSVWASYSASAIRNVSIADESLRQDKRSDCNSPLFCGLGLNRHTYILVMW